MASKSNPRRLSEILEEQQEPFRLEVYLYERGCNTASLTFKGATVGLHGRRKVKAWVLKVLPFRLKDWNFGYSVKERRKHEKPCLSTKFNSCSDSDNGSQSQSSHQNDDDKEWKMMEDDKRFSPISVLDEIELISNVTFSGQGLREQHYHHHQSRLSFSFPNLKKATEESIFSATLWELFIHKKQVVGSNKRRRSLQMNSMKAMQKTRKIVFDCVREAVERSHGRQCKRKDFQNFKIWDKQCVNGLKIDKLLRSEILSSCQKDDELEDFTEEVVKEVGDEILNEMADEIVHLYFSKIE